MTAEDLLPRLKEIRRTSRGYMARCPSHHDSTPSLAVRDGERGVLLKCWAGCSLREICDSLGLPIRDLFFDSLDSNPLQRQESARTRVREQRELERLSLQAGALIDVLREAEYLVRSRRDLDISAWTTDRLHEELDALGDAYQLLESEAIDG